MNSVTFVIVKLQVEGVHQWEQCNIDEVSYLKHIHRHNFNITCYKMVNSTNREIEIIQLKRRIKDYLQKYYNIQYRCLCLNNKSCEDIANELLRQFNLSSCEVLEDNENGARAVEVKSKNEKKKESEKKIIFVCGYPCSGKTSKVQSLINQGERYNEYNSLIIEVGDIVRAITETEKRTFDKNLDINIKEKLVKKIVDCFYDENNPVKYIFIVGIRQTSIISTVLNTFSDAIDYEFIWQDKSLKECEEYFYRSSFDYKEKSEFAIYDSLIKKELAEFDLKAIKKLFEIINRTTYK